MMKLSIQNQKPLVKVGKRGHYTMAEKRELAELADSGVNINLNLKALAAKWNRGYNNVKAQYYKLVAENKEVVNKELAKREQSSIPKFTVGKSKENVSKYSPHENPWTEFEDEILMEALEYSTNKKRSFEELAEVLDRTFSAINARYYYLLKKASDRPSLAGLEPNSGNIPNETITSFIPETPTDLFLEEVSVTMYKALDGSIHEKAQDAVKANIRVIIDSMATTVLANENADDSTVHQWFFNNKDKVEYLMNTNPEELW